MANETRDLAAHLMSLQRHPKSKALLDGSRYDVENRFEANQQFRMPEDLWDEVKENPTNNKNGFLPVVRWYVKRHYLDQMGRILNLQRYYLADNPIHTYASDKFKRADNRIASAFAQHITKFKNSLILGKPLKYGYNDPNGDNHSASYQPGKNLMSLIKNFNGTNDTNYHDALLGRDALVTGRAYELTYVKAHTNIPRVKRLNPNTTFVIYNTDVDPKELCAVRYYVVNWRDRHWYQIEVYTDDKVWHFKTDGLTSEDWQQVGSPDDNVYQGQVPITEYNLSETRQGCFESILDLIDSYDKSMSDMANSEDDFSNQTVVITGGKAHRPQRLTQATDNYGNKLFYKPNKPHTVYNVTMQSHDKAGNQNDPAMTYSSVDTKANVLFLDPIIRGGRVVSQPDIKTVTKSLPAQNWSVYTTEITNKIEQFSGVPNLEDNNSSNQTQLETASKLMSALSDAHVYESNFRHGIHRRLRLLYLYWCKLNGSGVNASDGTDPTDVTVHFEINLPLNVQETLSKLQTMNGLPEISQKTVQEVASTIDGVSQSEEATRVASEKSDQQSSNSAIANSGLQSEFAALKASSQTNGDDSDSDDPNDPSNNASNGSDQDDQPSDDDSNGSSGSSGDDTSSSSDDPKDQALTK